MIKNVSEEFRTEEFNELAGDLVKRVDQDRVASAQIIGREEVHSLVRIAFRRVWGVRWPTSKLPNLTYVYRAAVEFADLRGFYDSSILRDGIDDLVELIPRWQVKGFLAWWMRKLDIRLRPKLRPTPALDPRFLSSMYWAMYNRKPKDHLT